MWRNRQTHRPQKPAASGHEGSTPSVRTAITDDERRSRVCGARRGGDVPRRAPPGLSRAAVITDRSSTAAHASGRHDHERSRMGALYRARVSERTLLNLPGFHGGAHVYTYVEDTTYRGLLREVYCEDGCDCCPRNFEPRLTLEIPDCHRRISLSFDVDTPQGRRNSLHKLDTPVSAIRVFRKALVAEFEPYDRRARELDALRE